MQNPNLRSLELRRCLRLSDFTLQAVSVHARKLETLVLDMAAPANGVQTQSRLGMPAAVTDRGLIELARTCRNLRRVELTDCDVSDIGLDSLVIAGRDLEVLEISTTDTAMKALAAIAGANPGAVDIATLANSLPLRSLGDRSLQNLFRSCQALRRFKLSSRHLSLNVPGASLARLFQNCGRLASLDLSRSRVSDRALVAALSMSVAWDSGLLTELAGLYDSSDASGRLLLPLLRHLLLQDCAEIGDGSLAEISRAFPNLSVLSLARDPTPVPAGHPTIGDDATASLIDSLGGKLRLLDLSFSEVGPKTLARIAERCKKLEVLNLVGCRNVSTVDGLIESIVERCPRLRILGFDRETEQLLSIVGKHRSVGTRGQKAALRIARNRLVWEGWQLVEEVSGYKVFSCDLD